MKKKKEERFLQTKGLNKGITVGLAAMATLAVPTFVTATPVERTVWVGTSTPPTK